MATNATYKIFDASANNGAGAWVEYHFKTNAIQVNEILNGNSGLQFVSHNIKVNNVAFSATGNNYYSVTIAASDINWYGGTKPSTNYLGSAANIQAALVALDTAAKAAYDRAPDTSGLVPYTGATGNVNLGSHNLYAGGLISVHKNGSNADDAYMQFYESELGIYSPANIELHGGTDSNINLITNGTGKAYYNNNEIATKNLLGAAAAKGVATSVIQNSTDLVTSGAVWSAIDNLPEPMVFKGSLGTGGTITALPTASASNEGFTYKVITAGTYASKAAKVGDTFICAKTGTSSYEWVLIPSGDEPSGTVTNVAIANATNGGLTVSGSPITSSGTITIGLDTAYGDTKNPYGSKTAHYVLAAPAAQAGVPSFRQLTLDDVTNGSTRSLANYVPYTGATGDVNLGSNNLKASTVEASDLKAEQNLSWCDNFGQMAAYASYDGEYNYLSFGFDDVTKGGFELNAYNIALTAANNATLNNNPIATIHVGSSAPSSPTSNMIWIQTA